MPKRSRIRRSKWVGVATLSLLCAGWVTSLNLSGIAILGQLAASIESGGLGVIIFADSQMMASEPDGVELSIRVPVEWLPWLYYSTDIAFGIFVPFWIPVLLTAIPTAYLWRLDRKHSPGHCQKCGYDLTGNETGICPECGKSL